MSDSNPRVAAVQMTTEPDVSANLQEAERLVREAASAGAALVVLPENFAFMGRRLQDVLGLRNGTATGGCSHSSPGRRLGTGSGSSAAPFRWLPTTPVGPAQPVWSFNEHGERVARYDKIHLFDVDVPRADERHTESSVIEPGADSIVLESPCGRLGVAVCYDLRFPELFRHMLDKGVELLVVPAAFMRLRARPTGRSWCGPELSRTWPM